MSADIIDLNKVRQARAYRMAAEREDDLEYRELLEQLSDVYEAKALGGGLQSSAGPLPQTAELGGLG
jgi:hypothetical protein